MLGSAHIVSSYSFIVLGNSCFRKEIPVTEKSTVSERNLLPQEGNLFHRKDIPVIEGNSCHRKEIPVT